MKPTYEQKMELLDRYQKRPMAVSDPDIIASIKVDVVKASSKGVRRASDPIDDVPNELYNECMGIYRQFLKSRDSHLDMTGRKAKDYSEAMKNIIRYIRKFARSNQRPHTDADVLKGVKFVFEHWDRLNDFHRNRLALTDIHSKIEEILPMIKNGYDKKSASKNQLDSLEQSIKNRRQ